MSLSAFEHATAGLSGSSVAIARQGRTQLLVVPHTANTSLVVRLILSPAASRRLMRWLVALGAWAMTATVGWFTSTSGWGLW